MLWLLTRFIEVLGDKIFLESLDSVSQHRCSAQALSSLGTGHSRLPQAAHLLLRPCSVALSHVLPLFPLSQSCT
jgi:hypothetical protein